MIDEREAGLSVPSGFSPRRARLLLLVLEHAGVCLPRRYRTFSGIAHDRETHRFFDELTAGGFAPWGAVELRVVLDDVLAEPDVTWLGLARDKVTTFTAPPFCVAPDTLPRTTVGGVVRPFPDPFPIGLAPGWAATTTW